MSTQRKERKKEQLESIKLLKESGQKLTQNQLRFYSNNKHPKSPIKIHCRRFPGSPHFLLTDIRDFVTPRNCVIREFLNKIKLGKNDSDDQKAKKIEAYLQKNLKYVGDPQATGFNEFWQFPFETIALMRGDCEDGAILMASLLIASGIKPWRVRVGAGLVKTDSVTAPEGGHGWCCYLRESDDQWVPLDWCYLPETSPISKRKTLKENENYISTWFSWNNMFSWGRDSLEIDHKIRTNEL